MDALDFFSHSPATLKNDVRIFQKVIIIEEKGVCGEYKKPYGVVHWGVGQ